MSISKSNKWGFMIVLIAEVKSKSTGQLLFYSESEVAGYNEILENFLDIFNPEKANTLAFLLWEESYVETGGRVYQEKETTVSFKLEIW